MWKIFSKRNVCVILISFISILILGCTSLISVNERQDNVVNKMSNDSILEIHYIDVGQADATLLMCGEETMLIDGGNVDDSSLIYSYLKEHNVEKIDYLIATHAHEDHVGGLAGALNYAKVEKVFSTVRNYETEAYHDFVKYVEKQGRNIIIPSVGTEFPLGNAKCTVLAVNTFSDNQNDSSIVLRIDHGINSFLFCGDIEERAETRILNSKKNISCSVLKVPHHGSDESLSHRWLKEATPKYGIISVGKENSYGHPARSTLDKLGDANVKIYRTDLQGHILCFSDGKELWFELQKKAELSSNKKESIIKDTERYVLNTNTMKFHYMGCPSVVQIKENNKKEVNTTRNNIIAEGYLPCGNCKP